MEKKSRIVVMVKEPGENWNPWNIENRLEDFQQLVGGYIETVTVNEELILIVNEEGKLKGLPGNFPFRGDWLCGTVVAAGSAGEEFASCPLRSDEAMIMALVEDE